MLRRYLELTEQDRNEVDQLSFQNIIRLSYEHGLLKNSWDVLSKLRKARNILSHTHNKKANEVFSQISLFLVETKHCINEL